jgi:hypothetical protein
MTHPHGVDPGCIHSVGPLSFRASEFPWIICIQLTQEGNKKVAHLLFTPSQVTVFIFTHIPLVRTSSRAYLDIMALGVYLGNQGDHGYW